jgi:hypothetical protein
MKPAIKSKTLWGLLLVILPQVLDALGVRVSDEETQAVGEAFVTIFGFALALYGRMKASGPISGLVNSEGGYVGTGKVVDWRDVPPELRERAVFTAKGAPDAVPDASRIDGLRCFAMLFLGVCMVAAGAVQTGCASMTTEQRQTLTNSLIRGLSTLALNVATHQLVKHNPEWTPYMVGLRETITFANGDGAPVPDALEARVREYLADEYVRAEISKTLDAVLADYRALKLQGASDPMLREALVQVGRAIDLALAQGDGTEGTYGVTAETFAVHL